MRTQPRVTEIACRVLALSALIGILFVIGCASGGTQGSNPPPVTYTIGGTVSGLTGTGLVLQNNGGNNLSVSANGSFTFTTAIASGNTFKVTVSSQPSNPAQTCVVASGSGTASANVTSVVVTCTTTAVTYTIGGTVSGLTGTGLVLQDNGGNNLPVSANGSFTFTTAIASGGAYNVTVFSQPSSPAQTCAVTSGGSGTASANVTSVVVTCTTTAVTYTIGGTVSGLTGTGLVLQDNGGNNLPVSANGSFTFTTAIASGGAYNVTVFSQPSSPAQTCAVTSGGSGTASANVTGVRVTCTTIYTIGGTISGLTGTGLVLQNNGGNNLSVSANGSFTFTTAIASGGAYNVTVFSQPSSPAQTCAVTSGGSGTVASANVTGVQVTCTTSTYTIGGTVSGLSGAGLVLQDNGGNNLSVSANGSFTFTTAIASGSTFNVTILSQPPPPPQTTPVQECGVTAGGSGTVASANVTSVVVTCIDFESAGNMTSTRSSHTATLLNNGMVLIAGGYTTTGIVASAELYNPATGATGTFTATGSMTSPRYLHTATLLNNGMVLIAGGTNNAGMILNEAELYNPATGTFTATGSMASARSYHTATLLNNGMVLIAGGRNVSGVLASAELYNPATGSFTAAGSMTSARSYHTATLLNNGMVLIAGGYNGVGLVASAELYNSATGSFTATGSMTYARYYYTATLLNNGMVLIAGGENGVGLVASAELYNSATGSFTATGSMTYARYYHTATLLNNGMVLIAGGENATSDLASAELYNPATGSFTAAGSMTLARHDHTATLLNNGNVLVAGGIIGSNTVLSEAELYPPAP